MSIVGTSTDLPSEGYILSRPFNREKIDGELTVVRGDRSILDRAGLGVED
jgi:hypothetical protein